MTYSVAASTILAQAFRLMELAPISSFDDDSEQAQAAAEQYPNAIETCLEANDWSFASVFVNLPPVTPPDTFAADPRLPYTYEVPGDLLRIQYVGDGSVHWRKDLHYLRADQPAPLAMRYTAKITNEAALPATFREAVSCKLALLLAPRWLGTANKIQALGDAFNMALRTAMRNDARTASDARYDGMPDQGDWASEATR